mgnify:CR=1 FL=1
MQDRTQYTIQDYLAEAQYPHITPETYVYCDIHDDVRVIEKRDRTSVPIDEYECIGYVSRYLWFVYP